MDPCSDSISKARIEALKQVADCLPQRVAILDRQFNVIYANEAAWPATSRSE
jgi:hypothetical protein